MADFSPADTLAQWLKMGAVANPSSNYTTGLPPEEEKQFQQDMDTRLGGMIPFKPDLSPTSDYDYRGWWKAYKAGDERAATSDNPNDKRLHFPDPWKTPYHQSFSNESIYATPNAGYWRNNQALVDPKTGKVMVSEVPMASDVTNWQAMGDNPIAAVLKKFLDPGATASPNQYPTIERGILPTPAPTIVPPGTITETGATGGRDYTLPDGRIIMGGGRPGFGGMITDAVLGPQNAPIPGLPGAPFPQQPDAQGGQPQQDAQRPDWQQMVLDALKPPQQKEKSWADTGKELMAPLAVGLLSSLVHPYYEGPAGGLKRGIDAGVNLWEQQRVLNQQSRNAEQKNRISQAGVLARMGQSEAMERLRQAQMEQTGELRREGFAVQREGHQMNRENQIENLAMREQSLRMNMDNQQLNREQRADLARQHNETMVMLKQMGQGSKFDKPAPGLYSIGSAPTVLTYDQIMHPEEVYKEAAENFKKRGLTPQAEAAMDPKVQPLLGPNKSTTQDSTEEQVLANAGQTVAELNRIIKRTVPTEKDQQELDTFLSGKATREKPLGKTQDYVFGDTPEIMATKQAKNDELSRSFVKRYMDYLKYKNSYTDAMPEKVMKLLSTIGVARQQVMGAAMKQTGSRAFQAQANVYGAHIPDYADPIRTILDKNETIADSYHRTLFQMGRWDMIPKDRFNKVKNDYISSQGISEDTAPASAPTDDDWKALGQ